jgi:competence protein ComEC
MSNKIFFTIVFVVLAVSSYLFYVHQLSSGDESVIVRVVFMDIGQGDATFFEWSDGTQILVDCARDDVILEALGRRMLFSDRYIDRLIVTHPDLDHYGGCIDVLRRYSVGHILLNGDMKDNPTWQEFERVVSEEGAEITYLTGTTTWQFVSSSINFLYPDHDLREDTNVPGYTKDTGANNGSIIFRLDVDEHSLLMMADAEPELERYLLANVPNMDIDILKVPHHGSGGSSIEAFIASTTPIHSIFSAGRGNRYGHPSERVVRRVMRVGSDIYRTDRDGDIILLFRDDGEYYFR